MAAEKEEHTAKRKSGPFHSDGEDGDVSPRKKHPLGKRVKKDKSPEGERVSFNSDGEDDDEQTIRDLQRYSNNSKSAKRQNKQGGLTPKLNTPSPSADSRTRRITYAPQASRDSRSDQERREYETKLSNSFYRLKQDVEGMRKEVEEFEDTLAKDLKKHKQALSSQVDDIQNYDFWSRMNKAVMNDAVIERTADFVEWLKGRLRNWVGKEVMKGNDDDFLAKWLRQEIHNAVKDRMLKSANQAFREMVQDSVAQFSEEGIRTIVRDEVTRILEETGTGIGAAASQSPSAAEPGSEPDLPGSGKDAAATTEEDSDSFNTNSDGEDKGVEARKEDSSTDSD